MTNQHPITPPPELRSTWQDAWYDSKVKNVSLSDHIATQAALWGADQELEACCEWLVNALSEDPQEVSQELRTARRPKPPSDKELALAELDRLIALIPTEGAMAMAEPIRKVLEALPND
jgi:hypothetical protein